MGRRSRAILSLVVTVTALTGWAGGEMVVEWWGQADYCRHKGMKIAPADKGGHALTFDLSPIPKGAKVYHTSLRVHTRIRPVRTDKRAYMNAFGRGVFYYDPFRLYNEIRPDAPIGIYVVGSDGEPLKLEGPQFKSFDATEAVRSWVSGQRANKGYRGSACAYHPLHAYTASWSSQFRSAWVDAFDTGVPVLCMLEERDVSWLAYRQVEAYAHLEVPLPVIPEKVLQSYYAPDPNTGRWSLIQIDKPIPATQPAKLEGILKLIQISPRGAAP